MRERIQVFFRNLPSAHHRVMMRYLRKRGWVVFYLDERHRYCDTGNSSRCWLSLYQEGERREGR